jgi:hypothetical protein
MLALPRNLTFARYPNDFAKSRADNFQQRLRRMPRRCEISLRDGAWISAGSPATGVTFEECDRSGLVRRTGSVYCSDRILGPFPWSGVVVTPVVVSKTNGTPGLRLGVSFSDGLLRLPHHQRVAQAHPVPSWAQPNNLVSVLAFKRIDGRTSQLGGLLERHDAFELELG